MSVTIKGLKGLIKESINEVKFGMWGSPEGELTEEEKSVVKQVAQDEELAKQVEYLAGVERSEVFAGSSQRAKDATDMANSQLSKKLGLSSEEAKRYYYLFSWWVAAKKPEL